MVVFHEFFPVEKKAITAYVECQMRASGLSQAGGGDAPEVDIEKQSVGADESGEEPQQLDELEIKMKDLCASFAESDFCINSCGNFHDVDPQRFKVAACESFLSISENVAKAPPVSRKDKKDKSSLKTSAKKESPIALQKPKKTFEFRTVKKSASMPVISYEKPRSYSSLASSVIQSKPKKQALRFADDPPSPFVQKILKAAKEKHKMVKNEIKIPIVDLKLIVKRP